METTEKPKKIKLKKINENEFMSIARVFVYLDELKENSPKEYEYFKNGFKFEK